MKQMLVNLLCLQVLILFHELGHFLVARFCGMKVSCFSIGFGPRLASFKYHGVLYQLALLPLGGFVQIDGMNPEEKIDPKDLSLYPNKPMWQRFLVVLMGPVMNFVLAIVFFAWALMAGISQPDISQPVIGQVLADSAAQEAGLLAGDRVLKIGTVSPERFEEVSSAIRNSNTLSLPIVVQRGDEVFTLQATLKEISGAKTLGIAAPIKQIRVDSVLLALQQASVWTFEKTAEIMHVLGRLITGSGGGQLMGLPGIFKTMSSQAAQGVSALLVVLSVLSVNLGLFNLLPVPALDGGRLTFLIIEMIRRKPVSLKTETIVHTVGFVLLITLLLFVSIRDLLR